MLNKILPNQIQQHIKRILHHDKVGYTRNTRVVHIKESINVILCISKMNLKVDRMLGRARTIEHQSQGKGVFEQRDGDKDKNK